MSRLSTDERKNWLFSKACKGLDVPEALCEVLLSEDKAQIDLTTFLDGGKQGPPNLIMLPRRPSTTISVTGTNSTVLIYVEEIPQNAAKAPVTSDQEPKHKSVE